MCGIAGIVSDRPVRPGEGEAMAACLKHRGPDDAGVWTSADGTVVLAHRRLSIIDLSAAGHSPMEWDGGRYQISYNGEVYNFQDLRAELESAGCRFRSRTDTEVVVAAYATWGDDCVERFNGMFAIAIWDQPRKRLFLARDPLGKKPLYYARYGDRFAFASEQKALLSDPSFPRDLNREALALYLRYGYVPAPHSIFRASYKLPPGHAAAYEGGRLSVRAFWDPVAIAARPRRAAATEREAIGELDALLTDAVRLRMIADVPVGASLSGGIDSSLVTALMVGAAPGRVKTYSVAFESARYDESREARAVAAHLGTDHHEETCSAERMLGIVDRLPAILDEPSGDSSAVPTFLVSEFAREHVKVLLTGDGGDEVFFGYPRYFALAQPGSPFRWPPPFQRAAAMPASLVPLRQFHRAAELLREADTDGYARFVRYWPTTDIEHMTGAPAVEAPSYSRALAQLAGTDVRLKPPALDMVTYLPDDILFKVDRMSMAVGLESRCPLLDRRVVEFGETLPLELLFRERTGKHMLRALLRKRVPPRLWERPKQGFGVPLDDWFRGPLRAPMDDALAGGQLERLGLDPGVPRRQWQKFLSGGTTRTDLLWNVFSLVRWAEHWY